MNMPNIGKPATNALSNIGIATLEQVSQLDENNLLKIHGVGPKAVSMLKHALADAKLSFKQTEEVPYSHDFAVFGSLACNNAPKREIIRNFLIGTYANHTKVFAELCTEDFASDITLPDKKISTFEIISIITHGKEGAARGKLTTGDGEKYSWAHFIYFESHKKDSKIRSVASFTTR